MKRDYFNVAHHQFSVSVSTKISVGTLLNSFLPFQIMEVEPITRFDVRIEEIEIPADLFDTQTIADEGELRVVYSRIKSNNGHLFQLAFKNNPICCIFTCDADFTQFIGMPVGDVKFHHYGLSNLLMMAYALATATCDTLMFHSSVIMKEGKGYMFLGKSGTGKSTHTALWLKHIPHAELLNDDNPIVRIWPESKAVVYGSPWSGKTPCYKNKSVELQAIVRLHQASKNEIVTLKGIKSYAAVLPSISNMKWCKVVANGVHEGINNLLPAVAIYSLGCLPNQEAAELSFETISGE